MAEYVGPRFLFCHRDAAGVRHVVAVAVDAASPLTDRQRRRRMTQVLEDLLANKDPQHTKIILGHDVPGMIKSWGVVEDVLVRHNLMTDAERTDEAHLIKKLTLEPDHVIR